MQLSVDNVVDFHKIGVANLLSHDRHDCEFERFQHLDHLPQGSLEIDEAFLFVVCNLEFFRLELVDAIVCTKFV